MPPALVEFSSKPEFLVLLAGIVLVVAGRWLVRTALALAASVLLLAITVGAAMVATRQFDLAPTWGWVAVGVAALLGVVAGVWVARQAERVAFALLGGAAGAWLGFIGVAMLRQHDVAWIDAPFDYAVGVPVASAVGAGLFVWGRRWLLGATTVVLGTVLIMQALRWPWMGLPAVPIAAVGLWWQNGARRMGGRRRRRSTESARAGDDDDDE